MCKSCGQLHFYSRFRSALQYSHEISKIRGLVSFGDMAVESATVPLEDTRRPSRILPPRGEVHSMRTAVRGVV